MKLEQGWGKCYFPTVRKEWRMNVIWINTDNDFLSSILFCNVVSNKSVQNRRPRCHKKSILNVSKSSFRYHPPFCFLNVLPSPSSTLVVVTGMLDDIFRLAHLQGLEAFSLSPTPQHSSTQTQSNWTQLPQHVTVRASRTSMSGVTIHSKSVKVCGFCFSVSTNLQKKGKRRKMHKSRQQNFATKVHKSIKCLTMSKDLKPRTC